MISIPKKSFRIALIISILIIAIPLAPAAKEQIKDTSNFGLLERNILDLLTAKAIDISQIALNNNPKSVGEKAAENAKQLEGISYGFGGKGFDLKSKELISAKDIKKGYNWYNFKKDAVEKSSAIDCSGLIYWSFNTAAGKKIIPIHNANTMWTKDVNRNSDYSKDTSGYIHSKPPKSSDLRPGTLLFLDTPLDKSAGTIDHVAMYIGNGEVIHAAGGKGVEKLTYDQFMNKKISKTATYATYFAGYGSVKLWIQKKKSSWRS